MKVLLFLLIRNVRKCIDKTPLVKIPGLLRISNKLYHIFYPKGIISLTIQGNKMSMDAKDIGIVPWLLRYGVYEGYETELFKGHLKPEMSVLDIGANFGYYSLIAARAVGKEGRVFAFEPEEKSYEFLLKNMKANNLTNIIPVKKAISNKTGKRKLFLDQANLAAATFSQKNLHTEKEGTIEVQTTTLDEFLKDLGNPRVDAMKIDVQGAEGLVFEGAKNLLAKDPRIIFMEFWPFGLRNMGTDPLKLLQTLKTHGFTIQLIDETSHHLCTLPIPKIITLSTGFKETERSVNLLLSRP